DVGAVALEELVRLDREENIEIARRTAAPAGFAFTRKPDARAVLDARRNGYRERALLGDAAVAVTRGAGVVDRLAATLTGRARALDGEKALARAHLPLAGTGLAGGRARARACARTRARLAGDARRYANLRLLAGEGLGERDFHIVAEVGTAFARVALAAATAA